MWCLFKNKKGVWKSVYFNITKVPIYIIIQASIPPKIWMSNEEAQLKTGTTRDLKGGGALISYMHLWLLRTQINTLALRLFFHTI